MKNAQGSSLLLAAVTVSIALPIARGVAEEVATETATLSQPVAGYEKGFFIQSPDGKYRMVIGGYIQPYFDARFPETTSDTDTFRVRRARLKVAGHIASPTIQYELEYDFSSSNLLEGVLQWAPADVFHIRGGQYHVPFSLEQATSSSTLQFVDRSIAQSFFGIPNEREPGFGVAGALLSGRVQYDVGLFNGEGLNTTNQNVELRYAGRFVYNVSGHHGVDFSDTKWSESPQVVIAVGGMFNDTPDPATAPPGGVPTAEKQVTDLTVEAEAKYRGWGLHGAFFYQHTNPDSLASRDDLGWLAQAGYFVIPKKLEVAARVVNIHADAANDRQEYTGGMNYYILNGHQLKIQAAYGAFVTENGVALGNDQFDQLVQVQAQLKL